MFFVFFLSVPADNVVVSKNVVWRHFAEEKLRGIQTVKEPEFKAVIPFESDPFDRQSLFDVPLSGQDVFVNSEQAWQITTKSGTWRMFFAVG